MSRQDEVRVVLSPGIHPGPCVNYAGQDPDHYDASSPCFLHEIGGLEQTSG